MTTTANKNWFIDILKTHAVAIIIWVITASAWFGSIGVTMRWIDTRLSNLEKLNLQQVQWQVDLHSKAINEMQLDIKQTNVTVQSIFTQQQVQSQTLATIDKKLDKAAK